MRRLAPVVAALFVVLMLPTAAAAENTPDGPATIADRGTVACTLVVVPRVVMEWRVVVGEGGRAGTVRPRFVHGRTSTVGDPVTLPATPGTYTFPAPRVAWTSCGGAVDIVQETGRHAIVTREACRPTRPDAYDPCANEWLIVERAGQADERFYGARLTTSVITEPDWDGDLRGDMTEDRTDLRVSAAPRRDPDGRLRIAVTATNAGPRSADVPWLTAAGVPGGRWEGCLDERDGCLLAPLAAGESRTAALVADAPDALTAVLSVRAEGPDLVTADNRIEVAAPPAPAFDIVAADRQRITRGMTIQVRGVRAGRARVTVAVKVRGRTIRLSRKVKLLPYTARTLTIHARGAKLRSLRRAVRRGPARATITVRTVGGKTPVSTQSVVR